MYLLYILLTLMMLVALVLLAIPYVWRQEKLPKHFFMNGLFIIAFSSVIYTLSGNHQGLKQWVNGGEAHYQLLTQLDQLGGLDGLINRLEQRLKDHPEDTRGRAILAKLYHAKRDSNQ